MPIFNSRGDICAGVGGGTASVKGQAIASPAGGTKWLDDDTVVFQVERSGKWVLETYHVPTKKFVRASGSGANAIHAGGGVWAAWTPGRVRDSLGRQFPDKGLHGVSPTGTIAMTASTYQVGTGILLVRKDGSQKAIPATTVGALQLVSDDILVWTTKNRIQVHGLPVPTVLDGPCWTPKAMKIGSSWWILYQNDGRLVFHPWNETKGYVIHPKPETFAPDIVKVGQNEALICFSLTEGERPQDIKTIHKALTEPRVDLKKVVVPVPPPTEPVPTNPPDLQDVTFLHTDVRSWKETSRVTRVKFSSEELCIEHSKAGKWPTFTTDDGDVIEGNPWVIAFAEGKWYAATYEWLRTGQQCKGIRADNIGPHTKKSPVDRWVPKPGDLVGLFVSTPARSGERTVLERSNIVFVQWGRTTSFGEGPSEPPPPPSEPPVSDCKFQPCQCDTAAVLAAIQDLAARIARAEDNAAQARDVAKNISDRLARGLELSGLRWVGGGTVKG